jgi:hypothetical protein
MAALSPQFDLRRRLFSLFRSDLKKAAGQVEPTHGPKGTIPGRGRRQHVAAGMPPSQVPRPPFLQIAGRSRNRNSSNSWKRRSESVSPGCEVLALLFGLTSQASVMFEFLQSPVILLAPPGGKARGRRQHVAVWGDRRGFYAWITFICWSRIRIALVVTANSSASWRTMSSTLTPSRERPNQRRRTSANGISSSAANARASTS